MSAIPFPPQYHKGGHHSVTLRAELVWHRALLIGILSASLVGLTTLFDGIPDYIDQALDAEDIPAHVATLAAFTATTEKFQKDELASSNDIASFLQRINKKLGRVDNRLIAIEGETAGIDATTAAMAATQTLMWQQMTNLNAMTTDTNSLLTKILEEVTYSEETFRKRVRHALIGSTMTSTTTYEAAGQCDALPTECTLEGEAEAIVEAVSWV